MRRVLVAGATGYLGGYVAQEFCRRGHSVRALARVAGKLVSLKDQLDEIVEAEVTRPESLKGVCDNIDVVFSSVGITKQKDGLTFKDVDYQGNLNLLGEAQKAGVKKFIYVSAFDGPNLTHLAIIKAHEDFVEELKSSGIDYAVIRPTGYFSDMGAYLDMAQKGRVWLFGSGENRMNPVHGADLAVVCADAMDGDEREIDVGGPETMTHRQMAQVALEAAGKQTKISSVPGWMMKAMVPVARLFARHQGELLAFFVTMMLSDVVAPNHGTRTLKAHFQKS